MLALDNVLEISDVFFESGFRVDVHLAKSAETRDLLVTFEALAAVFEEVLRVVDVRFF